MPQPYLDAGRVDVTMQRSASAVEETYAEMEKIIGNLVECYALPHTKMCMRWSRPTPEAYREEVVAWLEDYARSFVRLPKKSMAGRPDRLVPPRARLDEEIARITAGRNEAVERSYEHLFR